MDNGKYSRYRKNIRYSRFNLKRYSATGMLL